MTANTRIRRIQSGHVHCDETSLERLTGTTKRKYKLFTNILSSLDIYTYLIPTTNQPATRAPLTIKIFESDWVYWNSRYPKKKSYIDIRSAQIAKKDEIIGKMSDPHNGFRRVGQLRQNKYEEIKNLRGEAHKHGYVSDSTLSLIGAALSEKERAESLVRQLGV